jgi:hypothetical protein
VDPTDELAARLRAKVQPQAETADKTEDGQRRAASDRMFTHFSRRRRFFFF